MSKRILKGWLGIAVGVVLFNVAGAQNVADPASKVLSARQKQVIRNEFSKIVSPQERQMAMDWSDAKKVGETMCRPVALRYFKKQYGDADRVFLGNDQSDSLTLESNELLTGEGQVRTGGAWHYFTFSCHLNPRNGQAISFDADVTRTERYSRPSI